MWVIVCVWLKVIRWLSVVRKVEVLVMKRRLGRMVFFVSSMLVCGL